MWFLALPGVVLYLYLGLKIVDRKLTSLTLKDSWDAATIIDIVLWPLYLLWVGVLYLYLLPEYLWTKFRKKRVID